jgi:pimeloyl-ACP methyl ester carboxylesterase
MQARLVLVHSPLAGSVAAGPPYHLRQAQVIADSADGRPAILIGHSRAGPLLAAAGAMLGGGVRGYVFVDARLPLAMLEETYPPAPAWPDAPGGYLQLSEPYEHDAARARELGWPVRQLLTHHLALLTAPGQVTHELRTLIGQL